MKRLLFDVQSGQRQILHLEIGNCVRFEPQQILRLFAWHAGAEGVDETVELLERRSREVGGNPADRATMLDPDYMAMVLAMDTLWAAGESAVTGLSQGEDCSAPEFSS